MGLWVYFPAWWLAIEDDGQKWVWNGLFFSPGETLGVWDVRPLVVIFFQIVIMHCQQKLPRDIAVISFEAKHYLGCCFYDAWRTSCPNWYLVVCRRQLIATLIRTFEFFDYSLEISWMERHTALRQVQMYLSLCPNLPKNLRDLDDLGKISKEPEVRSQLSQLSQLVISQDLPGGFSVGRAVGGPLGGDGLWSPWSQCAIEDPHDQQVTIGSP